MKSENERLEVESYYFWLGFCFIEIFTSIVSATLFCIMVFLGNKFSVYKENITLKEQTQIAIERGLAYYHPTTGLFTWNIRN